MAAQIPLVSPSAVFSEPYLLDFSAGAGLSVSKRLPGRILGTTPKPMTGSEQALCSESEVG